MLQNSFILQRRCRDSSDIRLLEKSLTDNVVQVARAQSVDMEGGGRTKRCSGRGECHVMQHAKNPIKLWKSCKRPCMAAFTLNIYHPHVPQTHTPHTHTFFLYWRIFPMGYSSILIGSVSVCASFHLTMTGSSSIRVIMLMHMIYAVSQLKSQHFVHAFNEKITSKKFPSKLSWHPLLIVEQWAHSWATQKKPLLCIVRQACLDDLPFTGKVRWCQENCRCIFNAYTYWCNVIQKNKMKSTASSLFILQQQSPLSSSPLRCHTYTLSLLLPLCHSLDIGMCWVTWQRLPAAPA